LLCRGVLFHLHEEKQIVLIMEPRGQGTPASEQGASYYHRCRPYVLEATYILRRAFYVVILSAISYAPLHVEDVLWQASAHICGKSKGSCNKRSISPQRNGKVTSAPFRVHPAAASESFVGSVGGASLIRMQPSTHGTTPSA